MVQAITFFARTFWQGVNRLAGVDETAKIRFSSKLDFVSFHMIKNSDPRARAILRAALKDCAATLLVGSAPIAVFLNVAVVIVKRERDDIIAKISLIDEASIRKEFRPKACRAIIIGATAG